MTKKKVQIIALNNYHDMASAFTGRTISKKLAKEISKRNYKVNLLEWYSLMFNKSYHLKYALESNLSKKELRTLEIFGAMSASKKGIKDFLHIKNNIHESSSINVIGGKIENPLSQTTVVGTTNKKGIKNLLTQEDTIPIVIITTGPNDLMFYTAQNPFSSWNETTINDENKITSHEQLAKDVKPIEKTIKNIKKTVEDVKRISPNAIIILQGTYVHPKYEDERLHLFKKLTLDYNIQLQKLCENENLIYHSICDENGHLKKKLTSKEKITKLSERVIDYDYSLTQDANKNEEPVESIATEEGLKEFLQLNQARQISESDREAYEKFDNIRKKTEDKNFVSRQTAIENEQKGENDAIKSALKFMNLSARLYNVSIGKVLKRVKNNI